jgi:hypothetical protein
MKRNERSMKEWVKAIEIFQADMNYYLGYTGVYPKNSPAILIEMSQLL